MIKFLVSIICLFVLTTSQGQKLYELPSHLIVGEDYLNRTIILKVNSKYRTLCSDTNINHPLFKVYSKSIGMKNLKKKFPNTLPPRETHNSTGMAYADLSLIYECEYTADVTIEKAITKLIASSILIYAEPHFLPKLDYTPNDPLANPPSQYHLQTIQAFSAWDINKGDSSITIGITDTGTDLNHNDLQTSIQVNINDPIDNNDNDNDGYLDNYTGWDLGMNDNNPTWESNPHGVHVCGIASAKANNAIGGSGSGFYCKFLPIKISNSNGILNAAYEGIKYAADHGCSIINCSWGGNGGGQFGQDVITYATINKNALVVAAAGNNNNSLDFYPAAYEHVLSVANTTNADIRHNTSNYGFYVDVCAPGENINSTWPGNLYANQTGTSMASPLVAGAAGIVKHQFPTYNALQIAERIKTTCDNIYNANPMYVNKLGTGRINLYRALTDPPQPSIVFSNRTIVDNNDNLFVVNDTLFISGRFTNYLGATSALSATINPLSGYAIPLDNTTFLGVLNTLSFQENTTDPFTFKLSGNIPINQALDFELIVEDGSYLSKVYFTVYVNVDYINIAINNITTTATSRGRIGYSQTSQSQGLGFNYKGSDLLYEAGLMIGIDTNTVSDCVRGPFSGSHQDDFSAINRIQNIIPSIYSDFTTSGLFNDNNASIPISIEIQQNTYAWQNSPNNSFVIWEYDITNTSTDTLKNLHGGIFADWDVDGGTWSENRSNYDTLLKMGYSFYTGNNGKYAGIKLLSTNAIPTFYAIDNVNGGNGGIDALNGFSTKEKYITLSTNRHKAGLNGNGNDIINVMSGGLSALPPTQSVKLAFALLGADSLSQLQEEANYAQQAYDSFLPTSNYLTNNTNDELLVFPNPSTGQINIKSKNIIQKIDVYTLYGKHLHQVNFSSTIDLSTLSSQVCLLKIVTDNHVYYKKVAITSAP